MTINKRPTWVVTLSVFFMLTLQACSDVNTSASLKPLPPLDLKINEGFSNALGFYDATPNFSWKLPVNSGVLSQSQYQIVVASRPELLPNNPDLWNSEIVPSGQTTFIDYEGKQLSSRQAVFWQVKYWNDQGGESSWSDIAKFELGLLSNLDWLATWIEIDNPYPLKLNQYNTPIHIPQHLRTEFTSAHIIKRARLYITAKGVFEAFINGQRVGNDILTPGYTPYKKRIETLTYDVTSLLEKGDNVLGIQLAEGWYAGRFGPKRHWHKKLSITPKVLAQLEIKYSDGSTQIINTNNNWKATQQGPVRTSGLYDGERYDANMELIQGNVAWHQVGYETSDWLNVKTTALAPDVLLQPKRHFTTKNKMVLPALSINQVNDRVIFDLGQNMVGVLRINIPMKKGQTLNLRFGEGINKDGSLFTQNLGTAKQLDYYTAKQDGVASWQPQFTFHGFRYVEISGFDAAATPELSWVSGVVQHTDFELTGQFSSSNAQLNQLQSNIEWGLRGNFLDIPTDCPQRAERLGWTGDALAFANTSLFIADSHAFWAAWLQSIREEQFDDHSIPVVVPNEVGNISQAGWSDAAVTIPWDVYWRLGDKNILAENYAMMTRWIEYHQTQLSNGISEMWTVGDWLQPYSTREDSRRGQTDHSLISTAFYARSVDLTLQSAIVLGKTQDIARYQTLLEEIKSTFQSYFFDHNGRLKVGEQTQTSYLLAIGFNLLDETMTAKAIPHLLQTFENANWHLRTGFLGTPLLAPVLDKVGRADIAFDLVFKQTYPSWLYSVTQGATTVWERWDGYTHDKGYADRAGSLNHYAYGAIGQWLYDRLAGISALSAGYKSIKIAPLIPKQLQFANSEFDSVHGTIKSAWEKTQSGLKMDVVIPPNTTAQIHIPLIQYEASSGFEKKTVDEIGRYVFINGIAFEDSTFTEVTNISNNHSTVIEVKPGEYTIEVKTYADTVSSESLQQSSTVKGQTKPDFYNATADVLKANFENPLEQVNPWVYWF